MRLAAPAAALAALAIAPAAHAATVTVEGGALRVLASPGEVNGISVPVPDYSKGTLTVSDNSTPPTAAGPCSKAPGASDVTCPGAGIGRLEVDAGDLDDAVTVNAPLPSTLRGGPGADALNFAPVAFGPPPGATLDGGDGGDWLTGGPGNDRLQSGPGDDYASGGPGDDVVQGDLGGDTVDGGEGADALEVRDQKTDSALCGAGRDSVRAEVLDSLDYSCERVDYGPPGRIGRLRPVSGGGRFVPIPGQSWARVDRRILPGVLYLIRKYKVRVGDGYALRGHKQNGEHPLGLAVDLYPGPGGGWGRVAQLARWAEPRQNRPRFPFRWVGWNGDKNHGDPGHCRPSRGCPPHLHLSWSHSRGRFGRPVRTVWVFAVR